MEPKVFNLQLVNRGVLKATAGVDHGNGLTTHFWRVLLQDGALVVAPPQIRSGPDHLDVLEFQDQKQLEEIKAAVLASFQAASFAQP